MGEFPVAVVGLGAVAQQADTQSTTEKVIFVLVGAFVGFLFAYALDRIKARREPRQRISWDLAVQQALVEPTTDIKRKVSFLYEGRQVEKLTHLRCVVTNSGNRVVKDHELRFPFPGGVTLLEHYLDPRPEEELGVEQLDHRPDAGEGSDGAQVRYRIAHLERGQSVVFTFVTAGGTFEDWHPRSFNAAGDVEFQRRDISVAKEDQEHLTPFAFLALTALILPPGIDLLDFGYAGDLAGLVVRVGLLAALLPHVRPLVRVLLRLIGTERGGGADVSNSIRGDGSRVVIQAGTIHGPVTFHRPVEDEDDKAGQEPPATPV